MAPLVRRAILYNDETKKTRRFLFSFLFNSIMFYNNFAKNTIFCDFFAFLTIFLLNYLPRYQFYLFLLLALLLHYLYINFHLLPYPHFLSVFQKFFIFFKIFEKVKCTPAKTNGGRVLHNDKKKISNKWYLFRVYQVLIFKWLNRFFKVFRIVYIWPAYKYICTYINAFLCCCFVYSAIYFNFIVKIIVFSDIIKFFNLI